MASLISDSQTVLLDEVLPAPILTALMSLRGALSTQVLHAVAWNDTYIGIPLTVEVQLPTRGPVGGIDIRREEPVYLLFDKKHYPYAAPRVFSNRIDFPSARLAHLNPVLESERQGASFCLHRGNLDDWYAEHDILDLLSRICAWLRDAARNRLQRAEDGFERIRLARAGWYLIYDVADFEGQVRAAWTASDGQPGSDIYFGSLLNSPEADPLIGTDCYAIRHHSFPRFDLLPDLLECATLLNKQHSPKTPIDRFAFGILIRARAETTDDEYIAEYPDNYGALKSFLRRWEVDIDHEVMHYQSSGLQLFGGIPITVAFRRPRNLIGESTDLEFLSFVIVAPQSDREPASDLPLPTAYVGLLGHRNPLTRAQAMKLSGGANTGNALRVLIAGAGALGSKVGMHFARRGWTNLTIVDSGDVSPHNLVRHALSGGAVGRPKAAALKEAIAGMYTSPGEANVASHVATFQNVLADQTEMVCEHDLVVDATASMMVRAKLIDLSLPTMPRVARCEIGWDGQIGILSVEGLGRNPRIDDIFWTMVDCAVEQTHISEWLCETQRQRQRTVGFQMEDIRVGISCSSDTMRVSDDVVSYHAASFSIALSDQVDNRPEDGRGLLHLSMRQGAVSSSMQMLIPAWKVLQDGNGSSWSIRLHLGAMAYIERQLVQHAPAEIGGFLVGSFDLTRHIVYVTRALSAPHDSGGTPMRFNRGTHGAVEMIRHVETNTGGLLGYIGDWHTHPMGGVRLSEQDLDAARELERAVHGGMPIFLLVASPTDVGVYLFEPGTVPAPLNSTPTTTTDAARRRPRRTRP